MTSSQTQSGIPYQVNGETLSLDPNSAEGKALERIRRPLPEDEYVTVGEVEADIDIEAIRKRIKQRGYKVQVSPLSSLFY